MRTAAPLLLALALAALQAAPPPPARPAPLVGGAATAIAHAYAHARRLLPEQVEHARYLWLAHLPPEERKEEWQLISAHVQGLSKSSRVIPPAVVLQDGSERQWPRIEEEEWSFVIMARIDLKELKIDPKVWEKLPTPHHRATVRTERFETETYYEEEEYGYWLDDNGRRVTPAFAKAHPRNVTWYRTRVEREKKERQVRKVTVADGVPPWLPAATRDLEKLTYSTRPVVFSDWFFWQTAIQNEREPAGYYDFTGIKDEKTFHELCGFDEKLFRERFKEFLNESLAAVVRSRVVRQPRRIARFEALGGAVYITFDNKLARNQIKDGKEDFRNPLSVLGREFKYDGTEQFGLKANKFWLTFAGDAQGKALASAPDFLGYDKTATGNTARIEVNLSCLACHLDDGLQDFRPYHQHLFRAPDRQGEPFLPLASPNFKKYVEAQELYFKPFNDFLTQDRAKYAAALKAACGLTGKEYAKLLLKKWAQVDNDVSLARACRELGTTQEEFLPALRAYLTQPVGELVLAIWARPADEGETIGVDQWHEAYPAGQQALAGWRALMGGGYKAVKLDIRDERCLAFRRDKGCWPCVEKAGKWYGWSEACKEAGLDWSGWPKLLRRAG